MKQGTLCLDPIPRTLSLQFFSEIETSCSLVWPQTGNPPVSVNLAGRQSHCPFWRERGAERSPLSLTWSLICWYLIHLGH